MREPVVLPGGHKYQPPTQAVLQRRINSHDKPGQHLWMMVASWYVADAQGAATGSIGQQILDTENLISFGGPVCLKCEEAWSRKLAARPCNGSATEPMPWP